METTTTNATLIRRTRGQYPSLIARRTRGGYNAAESATLLDTLMAAHSGDNLVHALVYNGFATEAQASRLVGG